MTSKEFVTWIKGFLEGKQGEPLSQDDIKLIKMKVESVVDPEDLPFSPGKIDPLQPAPWIDPSNPNPWNNPTAQCPKCGIDFNGIMGYVCTTLDCPMGAGPIICNIEG